MGSMEPPAKGDLPKDVQKRIVEIIVKEGGTFDKDRETDAPIELRPPKEALAAMLEIPMMGSKRMEIVARQFAWEPDFYVYNEEEDFVVPSKFKPEKMTPEVRKLARFWAEMCRFVLIQLDYDGEYGVGWIFEKDTIAAYVRENNEHWLLINPFHKDSFGIAPLRISSRDNLNLIYAAAVHEATHMADGITHHDESFAAAFTQNVARTANRGAQIEKIRKSIGARTTKPGSGTESIEKEQQEIGPYFGAIPSRDELENLLQTSDLDSLVRDMMKTIDLFDEARKSSGYPNERDRLKKKANEYAFRVLQDAKRFYRNQGVESFPTGNDWIIAVNDVDERTLVWDNRRGRFVMATEYEWNKKLGRDKDEGENEDEL
jgi:hypothetical protein